MKCLCGKKWKTWNGYSKCLIKHKPINQTKFNQYINLRKELENNILQLQNLIKKNINNLSYKK